MTSWAQAHRDEHDVSNMVDVADRQEHDATNMIEHDTNLVGRATDIQDTERGRRPSPERQLGERQRSESISSSATTDPLGDQIAESRTPINAVQTIETREDTPMTASAVPDDKCYHTAGCTCSPGATTPPRSTQPAPSLQLNGIKESKERQTHRTLHRKALTVLPKDKYKPSRYWIGVVGPNTPIGNIRQERDVIWMKGNRLTTIRTICKTVESQGVHEQDFDLACHGEVFESEDLTSVFGLDFYNDQVVIFKMISKVIVID